MGAQVIHVRVFARYREILGFEGFELALPVPPTVSALLEESCLASLPKEALVALNRTFVSKDAVLHDGDEVALMPPVSGG
jgi:molybdopterin converting factor small subunit